jgi:mannitol-1-phosphate 5-dehydrogenase
VHTRQERRTYKGRREARLLAESISEFSTIKGEKLSMKTAIQFGAGNIGRGFIGALLSQAGYHVTYADVNQAVIDKINEDKTYTVHVMDVTCQDIPITNIDGANSGKPEIVDVLAEAELITTAVGLVILPRIAPSIAQAIAKRKAQGKTEALNIIACENAIRASSQLKEAVYQSLNDEEKAYADEYVGFPDCSVDRIVPPVKSENFIDVVVENYYEWNVEKASFKGEIPQIEGMNLADNLMAYIERKLFTLNTGHAITAYLGTMKGLKTIDEAIADEKIYEIVHAAMTESGDGLIKKHGFDAEAHYHYIDKIIGRFKNPYLKDDVTRVGREPLRKLSPTDRLTKPMMTAYGYGLPVDHLILGMGAALHYNNPEDAQSVELQAKIADLGLVAAIKDVTGITEDALIDRIVDAYNTVADKI